ncbi:MAG: helix-turn-helix domain-containing protein [Paludibacter sp.]|uniref:helix-turn-helix domain-containing protein n=1 Tax=Dysgonomonas sp. HDW5A TaxID=2714926 RepID=UPI001407FC79|nr:helix-turn-helix domain-containing protein [Dysgonomonas sp. HDW5A]MBP6663170.1 helix-turn-helix domain-containing protein [Paludibacter sp.]MBP9481779.1 helix-turn-helix domain-containing protein [Parabacteroides sp.]MBP7613505.1 helix-turn-helix domain-containing protein [Paludibacter sp.]MBP9579682.1 helix-turn-helix domain-containing protein [Parabacteroides sp.]QIK61580.1 helix-turn-helix domain-containing protein [Dysgonomonas sp. HDW5A]
MEIVNIEAKTFEAMLSKFESFATRMEYLCRLYGDKESEWLDNQDVCMLLNISPRTLQTLRDNGTLAYSQINHKTYYKPQDVEKALPLVEEKRKQANHQGKKL